MHTRQTAHPKGPVLYKVGLNYFSQEKHKDNCSDHPSFICSLLLKTTTEQNQIIVSVCKRKRKTFPKYNREGPGRYSSLK